MLTDPNTKDFEKAARLHANNKRSMHEQAKAAYEGYGESRTAAQRDNWNRYKEYDRQERASGNMFAKRERSKQAYDNSLASKVDSAKRKARLTQDKAKNKISDAVDKVGEKVYDAAGGSHKKNAEGWRKMAREESNAARASEKSAHENSARAASQDRKYGSGGDVYRRAADSDKENAETHRSNAKGRSERAASEQAAYEKSLAGRYDKMKADLYRKKSARKDKAFSGTSPKAKKQISNARDDVEKAARSNEGAYKHAKEVYRQTGSDSDAYKQAIKRSRTTLQRSLESQKRLKKKSGPNTPTTLTQFIRKERSL